MKYILPFFLFCLIGCRTSVKWAGAVVPPPSVSAPAQRLLVVSYDSMPLRELAVSMKNHLAAVLKPSFSEVKNKNIRADAPSDADELKALLVQFAPDYVLRFRPVFVRTRPFKMAGYTVPKVREVHWEYRLVRTSDQAEIWNKKLIINHLFDSETTTAARKAALLVAKEWTLNGPK